VSPATPTQPLAQYQLVSTAIAAAVADGHGATSHTVILVYPGSYTEAGAITLVDGIDIIGLGAYAGLSDTLNGDVVLNNDITGAATMATGVTLRGLTINGQINLTGAGTQTLTLQECTVTPTVPAAALNQGTIATTNLTLVDSVLIGNAAPAVVVVSTATLLGKRSSIIQSDTTKSVTWHAGGTADWEQCQFSGEIELTGAPAFTFNQCRIKVSGRTHIDMGGTSTVLIRRSSLDGDPSPAKTFSGTGTLTMQENESDSAVLTFQSTIGQALRQYTRTYSEQIAEGAGPITVTAGKDLVTCLTAGNVGVVVNLPALNTVGLGERITISNATIGAGTVVVTPNGAETISLAATWPLATAGASVTLQATATNKWIVCS
jgi:hypothetical protein